MDAGNKFLSRALSHSRRLRVLSLGSPASCHLAVVWEGGGGRGGAGVSR